MNEENYRSVKSLPDGVDEIISEVKENSFITQALIKDEKFFDEFTALLSDLNEIVSEEKESVHRYSQISLF